MKNLTVSVDEESYRNVRIAAAQRGVSVSGLVREFFRSLQPEAPDARQRVQDLFEVMDECGTSGRAAARERDRSKLYDR